ncbi:hypothetical protein [Nitratiruptor sp. YY09-18]|uniref:hypothetical protein n=1 Tax=Nitratiruptor sp. YY09-18 TaxID=2724901 RepID=UPI001915BE84|nr:hypothetical protein [Nitratiruptor sp. YY09-18]BCD68445.1 hypothetical protein NitYY0918_C1360 [Nitratiruptor sp. YY09-18]
MCLIITLLFLALAVWSSLHADYIAALLYGAIALVFGLLLVWNIKKTWKDHHKI